MQLFANRIIIACKISGIQSTVEGYVHNGRAEFLRSI